MKKIKYLNKELSDEMKREIELAEQDVKGGRVYSLEEVKKMFNF